MVRDVGQVARIALNLDCYESVRPNDLSAGTSRHKQFYNLIETHPNRQHLTP